MKPGRNERRNSAGAYIHTPLRCFKPDTTAVPDMETDVMEVDQPRDEPIRCAACMGAITETGDRIQVNGAHHHTFANPHGLVFEIGCFQNASGCGAAGNPTSEFTWFSGFVWQMAFCRTCLNHLGWLFIKPSDGFWGLILDRLIQQRDTGGGH